MLPKSISFIQDINIWVFWIFRSREEPLSRVSIVPESGVSQSRVAATDRPVTRFSCMFSFKIYNNLRGTERFVEMSLSMDHKRQLSNDCKPIKALCTENTDQSRTSQNLPLLRCCGVERSQNK